MKTYLVYQKILKWENIFGQNKSFLEHAIFSKTMQNKICILSLLILRNFSIFFVSFNFRSTKVLSIFYLKELLHFFNASKMFHFRKKRNQFHTCNWKNTKMTKILRQTSKLATGQSEYFFHWLSCQLSLQCSLPSWLRKTCNKYIKIVFFFSALTFSE